MLFGRCVLIQYVLFDITMSCASSAYLWLHIQFYMTLVCVECFVRISEQTATFALYIIN